MNLSLGVGDDDRVATFQNRDDLSWWVLRSIPTARAMVESSWNMVFPYLR